VRPVASTSGDPAPAGGGDLADPRASSPDATPGPSAPEPEAKNLDEPLAVVEGTVITRRRLSRALGERASTQEEAEFEQRLGQRLKDRAVELILLKAADREGLRIPPEVLDDAVRKRRDEAVRDASKKAGRPVAFEELLANENLTIAEFREKLGNQIVIHHYFESIWKGLPGKRPRLDLDPSPSDLRRLYNAHAKEFDVPHQVRFAFWVARPLDFLDGGRVSYDAATEAARARLETFLAPVRSGADPEALAARQGITKGNDFNLTKPVTRDEMTTFEKTFLAPKATAVEWAFHPTRRARETAVFEGARGALYGIAVLEVTAPRRRAFEDPEVQDQLVAAIRNIRKARATEQHILELLTTASVHPPMLAEAIEADARRRLKEMDSDPVKRDVKLR
jgi:hypothetical protein